MLLCKNAMTEFKNYLFIIILVFSFGCQGNDDISVQEEKVITPIPAEPVNIAFPEVNFTEPEKIREGIPSPVIYDRIVDLVDATPENASIYLNLCIPGI
jgi:hypothetical protein